MLVRLFPACHAASHPPEKERRLVSFAQHTPLPQWGPKIPDMAYIPLPPELVETGSQDIVKIEREARQKMIDGGILRPSVQAEKGQRLFDFPYDKRHAEEVESDRRQKEKLLSQIGAIESYLRRKSEAEEEIQKIRKEKSTGLWTKTNRFGRWKPLRNWNKTLNSLEKDIRSQFGALIDHPTELLESLRHQLQTLDERGVFLTQAQQAAQHEREARLFLQELALFNSRRGKGALDLIRDNQSLVAELTGTATPEGEAITSEIAQEQLNALQQKYRNHLIDVLRHPDIDKTADASFDESRDGTYQRAYQKAFNLPTDINFTPPAFQTGNKLHFDIDNDEYFRLDESVSDTDETSPPEELERAKIERNCTRNAMHELAHLALDKPKRGRPFVEKVIGELKNSGKWDALRTSVDTIFRYRIDEKLKDDQWYAHEIIALYFGGRQSAYRRNGSERDKAHQTVFTLADTALTENRALQLLIEEIATDVGIEMQWLQPQLFKAVMERKPLRDASDETWDELTTFRRPEAASTASAGDDEKELLKQYTEELQKKKAALVEIPDTSIVTAESVITQIHNYNADISDLRRRLGGKGPNAIMKGTDKEEQFRDQGVQAADAMLAEQLDELLRMENMATAQKNWSKMEWEGGPSIEKKAEYARLWSLPNADGYTALEHGHKDMQMNDVIAELQRLDNDAESKKKRGEVPKFMKTVIETLNDPINKIKDYEKDKAKNTTERYHDPSSKAFVSWLKDFSTNGVEWLCVYDILKIFKIYKEAIIESYHAQQNIVSNKIAKEASWIMEYVPYGKPVRQIINRQARSANDEETNKYADYLKNEGFTYDKLFEEPNGLYYQNENNINRRKAVLEYAADHAWLYKLDKENPKNVYGINYIELFGEQKFRELVQKNEAGKSSEEKRGYERVDKDPDIPLLIDMMVEELRLKNIFAIKGLLKRLQEKAKYAESNAWGATTLLSAMRGKFNEKDTRMLLDIMDKGLLDDIGGIGIGQSAWTLTWFKVLRHELMDWKYGARFENNIFTRTISAIEDRLAANGETFNGLKDMKDQKNKDHAVARILAGQTYKCANKKYISIFEDDFTEYREDYRSKTATTSTSPKETDDDFFNPGNGGSDVLLLDNIQTAAILEKTSTGTWINTTKAPNFVTQVFLRDEDLEEKLPRAKENFRKEMKAKFTYWMNQTDDSRRAGLVTDIDLHGRVIIQELHKRGMLLDEHYAQMEAKKKSLNKGK